MVRISRPEATCSLSMDRKNLRASAGNCFFAMLLQLGRVRTMHPLLAASQELLVAPTHHDLEWMSKLCAMALPKSKVPSCPSPSLSTLQHASSHANDGGCKGIPGAVWGAYSLYLEHKRLHMPLPHALPAPCIPSP